jgi:hypothetical protein
VVAEQTSEENTSDRRRTPTASTTAKFKPKSAQQPRQLEIVPPNPISSPYEISAHATHRAADSPLQWGGDHPETPED